MSIISRTLGSLAGRSASGLNRFNPEPASRSTFFNAFNAGSAVVGAAADLTGVGGEFQALIQQQLEVQRQMQVVSFVSNNEKSRHETQMAAVRNIRVG